MIEIRRRVIQAIRNGAVHVEKSVLLSDGVDGMAPEQHGGVPKIGRGVRVMEVLKQVATNDPVLCCVGADAVEVANACAVVPRRGAGVLEPAVFDAAVGDTEAV